MKKKTPYHHRYQAPRPFRVQRLRRLHALLPGLASAPYQGAHLLRRTRALIGGADEEDLAPAARGCILCGSCEPLCPMGIRTQAGHDQTCARNLSARGFLPKPIIQPHTHKAGKAGSSCVVIPGRSLRRTLPFPLLFFLYWDRKPGSIPTTDTIFC